MEFSSPYEIPQNSLSVFIGRICAEPNDSFADNGILYVDIYNLDGSNTVGESDNKGYTTQFKALASWTLRAAYIAWNNPPNVKFKGRVKLKGKVAMSNAQLSNVTISGGPPMQGTTTCAMGPGTAVVPVSISSASGSAKIEQGSDAEIEMETDGDNFDIELTSQTAAQLPWCVKSEDAQEGDDLDETASFIQEGDFALCLAIGNNMDNLYVVDIFR